MHVFSLQYPWVLIAFPFLLYCLLRCKSLLKKNYFPHLHFFGSPSKFKNFEWILKILTLALMIIALANPQIIDYNDPRNRNGVDIVLALDGSGSMNASGFGVDHVSRFESVQNIASNFVMKRQGDNFGIVLFGDFAFIASPITYEKEVIKEMISYLNVGMAGENTAIGEGIAQSVRALRNSKAKTKIIILLTDGEHNSGSISPKEAIKMVQKEKIRLYTIGIGKPGEFDSKLLSQMAQDGGGQYFKALNNNELAEVYDQIDHLERSKIKSNSNEVAESYYYWPLGGSLLLLLLLGLKRKVRL